MVRYSWESWRLWWTSSLAWTESTAWSMSLYSPYTLSLASKTITQSTGGFRKRDLNKKKLEKIFSWTGAGLFIATQLTPLPSSWDSVSGQTISSLLLSGQITSFNDQTNKKWKDISQINNQIQNLVIFFTNQLDSCSSNTQLRLTTVTQLKMRRRPCSPSFLGKLLIFIIFLESFPRI